MSDCGNVDVIDGNVSNNHSRIWSGLPGACFVAEMGVYDKEDEEDCGLKEG